MKLDWTILLIGVVVPIVQGSNIIIINRTLMNNGYLLGIVNCAPKFKNGSKDSILNCLKENNLRLVFKAPHLIKKVVKLKDLERYNFSIDTS